MWDYHILHLKKRDMGYSKSQSKFTAYLGPEPSPLTPIPELFLTLSLRRHVSEADWQSALSEPGMMPD